MSSHQIQKDWKAKLKAAVPFGLGQAKPKHFRDMASIAWRNRDNLGYAWRILSRGVCDGCALGVAGFHDWTIDSVHLCMTRLNLLRLSTMPALDVVLLEDVAKRLDKAITLVQEWLDDGKGEVKQADLYALQSGKALLGKYQAQAGFPI